MQNQNMRNQQVRQEKSQSRSELRESGGPFDDSLRRTLRRNKTQYYESLVKIGDERSADDETGDGDEITMGQSQIEKLTEVVKNIVIKNKLNSRNAFQVPLIDVASLGAIKENEDGAWNKISNALQNSTKVYGFRVDFMVEGINKMTNNMARTQKTQQIETLHRTKVERRASESVSELAGENREEHPSQMGWDEQIYQKHIEKEKINQSSTLLSNHNSNHSTIRRLFDQNGVAGLLMGKLPIATSLNIVIDLSIQYPPIRHSLTLQPTPTSCNRKTSQFDMQIAEQINCLKHYCFGREAALNLNGDGLMEDCCNLQFDQQPQYSLQNSCQEGREYYLEQTRKQELFTKTGMLLDQQQLLGAADISKNESATQQSMINSKLNLTTKNENPNNKNKPKGRRQNAKKEKLKQQATKNIDFSTGFQKQDRSSILSAIGSPVKKERKKVKDKHMLKRVVPDFAIQQPTNYKPILPAGLASAPFRKSEDSNFKLDTNQLSQNNLEMMISQFESSIGLLAAPNIKDTKSFLWEHIKTLKEVQFSSLVKIFQKQRRSISQPLLFLAVLHLGNQYNLLIKEGANFQIEILNKLQQM